MIDDLHLTDEDIWGKENTQYEDYLEEEVKKLKLRIIKAEDNLEIAEYALEQIEDITKKAIGTNIHKTQLIQLPVLIKQYREELLTLRAIEKELKDYKDRIKENE